MLENDLSRIFGVCAVLLREAKGRPLMAFQYEASAGRLIATEYQLWKVNVVPNRMSPQAGQYVQGDELVGAEYSQERVFNVGAHVLNN